VCKRPSRQKSKHLAHQFVKLVSLSHQLKCMWSYIDIWLSFTNFKVSNKWWWWFSLSSSLFVVERQKWKTILICFLLWIFYLTFVKVLCFLVCNSKVYNLLWRFARWQKGKTNCNQYFGNFKTRNGPTFCVHSSLIADLSNLHVISCFSSFLHMQHARGMKFQTFFITDHLISSSYTTELHR
jgi:hypothetical protein